MISHPHILSFFYVVNAIMTSVDACEDTLPDGLCSIDLGLCDDPDYGVNTCPVTCQTCLPDPVATTTAKTPKPGDPTITTTTPRGPFVTTTTPRPACTGSCRDTIANCNEYLDLCDNPNYTSLLAEKCACTCRLCSQVGCQDASPLCADWARNGFCTSTSYTTETKKAYCAKTCNLC